MEYRELGKTGLQVSRLGFGSLTVSPLQADLPIEAGAEIIAYAIRQGIHLIDTAQYYRNYTVLRRALALAGHPDHVVLASQTYAWNRVLAEQAVEEARHALDRDVIDLFMLHEQESMDTLRGHRDALDYLYTCKEKGILRAVGASTHRIAAVDAARRVMHETGFGLDVIFALCNRTGIGIGDGSPQQMLDAVGRAKQDGLGTMAMKVLGGGTLHGSAESSLLFMLERPEFDVLVIGMQSCEEVDANIAFLEKHAFPAACADALAARKRRLFIEPDECVGCGVCVRRCGQGALTLRDGHAEVRSDACVLCGYCAGACPAFAIRIL